MGASDQLEQEILINLFSYISLAFIRSNQNSVKSIILTLGLQAIIYQNTTMWYRHPFTGIINFLDNYVLINSQKKDNNVSKAKYG
jgi:hypothetical protein